MSVTHTFTLAWRSGAGASKPFTVPVTGDTEINTGDLTVAAGDADAAVTVAVDVSELNGFLISSTRDVVLTTNAGAQTFNLKAGKPMPWYADSGIPNPLTTDITALHFNNAGTVPAVVNALFLVDNVA